MRIYLVIFCMVVAENRLNAQMDSLLKLEHNYFDSSLKRQGFFIDSMFDWHKGKRYVSSTSMGKYLDNNRIGLWMYTVTDSDRKKYKNRKYIRIIDYISMDSIKINCIFYRNGRIKVASEITDKVYNGSVMFFNKKGKLVAVEEYKKGIRKGYYYLSNVLK